uniref:UvrABC system protein C n=1 Tax=uncultured Armatimonadetes bacterium TaxID=157466 RepID=A0A6J4HPN7_9BACT|nr:Excinuclease ABC subunit C [uncultured Armatimonadetes bacterium]
MTTPHSPSPVAMTLAQKLENLPTNPGCYLYKDKEGTILYVGKAVNLRNRVRSYFHKSADHSPKTRRLVAQIADMEWIVTDTELEALILECNLIKKHRPKYNIRLRDDKHYPYLMLTTSEPFPRVLITRRVKQGDGNKYFGPYTNSHAVYETTRLIYRLFPLVTCRKYWTNNERQKPCLYHHMGRCPEAPCAGLADKERYAQGVKDAELFLSGRQDTLIREMERQMDAAAEDLQFERAAKLRDQIHSLRTIAERQKVVNTTQGDQDVIAVVNDEAGACVQMFFIRGGKLIGQEHFLLDGAGGDGTAGSGDSLQEATAEFVKQYYQDASFVPSEILLPAHLEELEIMESWLRQKKGAKVTINVPERGEKKHLIEMAATNARLALEQIKAQSQAEQDRNDSALRQLALALEMPDNLLTRIEAYDISNVQGRHAVGGMIVFERGKPKKAEYRRFKIENPSGDPNDFAMMYEVLTRRFNQMTEGNPKFTEEPDLILIDGGKGQLNAARDAMKQFGYDFPMIGLAKQFELVFVPGRDEPIELPRNSAPLFLLQRVRDEVHRFAIAYHRNVRGRAAQMSVLDEIPGIGPTRRRALLKFFGSVEKMRQATAEELAKAPGMNGKVAGDLYAYLRGAGTA